MRYGAVWQSQTCGLIGVAVIDEGGHCGGGQVGAFLTHNCVPKVNVVPWGFVCTTKVGWVNLARDVLKREVAVEAFFLAGKEATSNVFDARVFAGVVAIHDRDRCGVVDGDDGSRLGLSQLIKQ